MDRRDFLKKSAFAAGTGLAAANTFPLELNAAQKQDGRITSRLETKGWVKEPARKIPLVATADVVVAGGGAAGVAAAVSAARQGAQVLLLERYAFLGGLWLGGLVLPVLSTHGRSRSGAWEKVIHGFCTDMYARIDGMGMIINPKNPTPDPEAAKYMLDRMLEEHHVQVLYHVLACGVVMSGSRIDSLILETKSGRVAVQGKVYVDCTGDGDIFANAGEDYREMKYHIGAMWRVGNAGRLKKGIPTPVEGVKIFHTRGEEQQDGLDMFNLSRLQVKLRKEMWDKTQEARALPGGENLFLLETPPQLGVRVTRVLSSRFDVTLENSMNYVSYPDSVGMSGGSDTIVYQGRKVKAKERPIWQIPYRALVPRTCPNLLVAGRCFGFDDGMAWDAREVGTCFVTGQAAGTAAGIASESRSAVAGIDIQKLQGSLRAQNVML
ncbi:MAG: FAD-dependent oxidoreductase [Bacteroidales bacterium]|nr:FAD-dependent oxidoreductase [Bacteroidales bacterium]